MKKLFLLFISSWVLQSCFVAKEYKLPEMDLEIDALYRTDYLPQDTTSLGEVSWKQLFTDPVLISHIETGLENNLDIRIAVQQILAAEAYMKQGRAGYFPSLNLAGQVTHQELSRNSQFGSFFDEGITQYEIAGNLGWEADIWGRIRSNQRAFEASYLQSRAAHQAVKTRLIASIATGYFELLALDEQLRITQETIHTRQQGMETSRALKDAGILTEVGVKQTEAQVYTAQAILIDIKNEIRLLENMLSILLGETPGTIERTALNEISIKSDLYTGVPVQLLKNRPDLLEAEYNLINAFELTNVARSDFYPSLRITATGGLQSLELKELFSVNSLFASLVGSLAQPIFMRRQIKTRFEVAESLQEQAALNFQLALLNAGKEVTDALYNFEANTEKITILTQEFDAYNLAMEYSEELLQNGMANYLEVLNARENSLNSQLNLVNARFGQLRSVVDLYRALGGGWQ